MTAAAALNVSDRSAASQPLLSARGLVKHFAVSSRIFRRRSVVRAVDGISFDVGRNETLGIVGESGCGKSTAARILMHLLPYDAGEVLFDGAIVGGSDLSVASFRRQVQMVFQDSYSSLNPRLSVEDSIAFGAREPGRKAKRAFAHELLRRVGLEPFRFADRYPHELSGGQRQRVNIARALALRPRLLILDEAVSALDKSIEAQVLNLLLDLKAELGLSYIFISHDLNVVRFISDRVMVMYLGKVVEIGRAKAILRSPRHPYTSALLASMPSVDPDRRTAEAPIAGDPPNPIDPPGGCRFHTRCKYAAEVCRLREPALANIGPGNFVACHLSDPASGHPLAMRAA